MTHTSGGGDGLGDGIRNVVGKVHGTGEAIRGITLSALDQANGDHAAVAKNEAVVNKGIDEFRHGNLEEHQDQTGVAPTNARVERTNTAQSTSTNHGLHSTTVSKLEPRFNSDADHRADPLRSVCGTVYTPPTLIPLQSAQTDGVGEQPQPAHWPQHEHRGSIGGDTGLEAAHKFDPLYETGGESMHYAGLTNIHQHRGSIGGSSGLRPAEKLDPPEKVHSPSCTQTKAAPPRPTSVRDVLNIDTEINSPESDEAERHGFVTHTIPQYDDRYQNQKVVPDTYNNAMLVEPEFAARRLSYSSNPLPATDKRPNKRRTVSVPKHEVLRWGSSSKGKEAGLARVTTNAHKSDFLNLLDPRVDREAVRGERQSAGAEGEG